MSTVRSRRRARFALVPTFATLATLALLAGTAGPASGQAPPTTEPTQLAADPVAPSGRAEGPKAPTSRLAETDPELLARTDATRVGVMIKLDYDAIATYAGGVQGIPATSPAETGEELTEADATQSEYAGYAAEQEAAFVADLEAAVPEATVGRSFRLVYGGVSAILPANRVEDVLALDGVVAVQEDGLQHILTDSSNEFMGSPAVWSALGGQPTAGAGVLFGGLDTGGWPEHPSFAANPALPPIPTRPDGTAITCDFGDNPLTPEADEFACNNKLVGGYPFIDTYNAIFGGEVFPDSARDSNGHGTHTATTSAGGVVAEAPILGEDRGPVSGVAPGAQVVIYKVCGLLGCFPSDSAAAVEQAILDGVDAINFSISGGTTPFTDPVELAFLDAFAAGVFVSASAGNEGPGASTANHLSGWVTSVGASTQLRRWTSTAALTGTGGATGQVLGTSVDPVGVPAPAPVVLASAAPYSDALCETTAAPGTFTGMIVGCQRGPGRVAKGFNVAQGGAVGMVLYNAPGDLFPEMSDTHFIPTVHTRAGATFLDFLAANPGATATISPGAPAPDQGDVMAAFSSRGPAGEFIKPDVTAPGVQILAGNTPVPDDVAGGPPGQLFQSIGGTSMSSPHTAGASLLLAALHPEWTPSQIRSALMTTATTDVLKEDRATPADPFDQGAGRIDLNVAGQASLTFDETAENYALLAGSPLTAIHLNLPSVNAPVMPGRVTTTRTATNVTSQVQRYNVLTTAEPGSQITVEPQLFTLPPGQSVELRITISSRNAGGGQEFGEIRIDPWRNTPELHLPVAFVPTQGEVTLSSTCAPLEIRVAQTTECGVTATNNTFGDTTVDVRSGVSRELRLTGVEGGSFTGERTARATGTLSAALPGVPSVEPGALFGYIPLADFGIVPIAVGDEEIVNFDVPPFLYNGVQYAVVGVDSNGYAVVGGGTAEDNLCCPPQELPDPARPNNVLAPFWSDLTGEGAAGILAAVLTDDVTGDSWLIFEWQVNAFGTDDLKVFQAWIGLNGEQDITFAYPPGALPDETGLSQPVTVGAENVNGSGGGQLDGLPTGDLRVVSTDPTPGGSLTMVLQARALQPGVGYVLSSMTSPAVLGTTIVTNTIQIRRR